MALLTAAINTGQVAFLFAFIWSFLAWSLAEFLHWLRPYPDPTEEDSLEAPDAESAKLLLLPTAKARSTHDASSGSSTAVASASAHALTACCTTDPPDADSKSFSHSASSEKVFNSRISATEHSLYASTSTIASMWTSMAQSGLVSCLQLNRQALVQHRLVLRAVVEFGGLMLWFFLADRTTMFQEGPKSYSRDLFMLLFMSLTAAAAGSSLQALRTPALLNRPQTEEWKGWMQVLFLLYHYFEAKEAYNAIRIFIAAYVWMTGFGNFSYYYKTGDFCIGRFAQMMWRLNFLVFFACVVLCNSYMLYYICPMHTIFTVLVYVVLAIAPHLNKHRGWMLTKLLLSVALVYVTWDVKRVFTALWSPLTWLLGYSDPRKPTQDPLHEWYFRSSLDRYVWIYGMLCAWIHPQVAAFFKFVDDQPAVRRFALRSFILAACGGAGYWYYSRIYVLPKYEYNVVHPYTSWIPITLWIVVRNMTPSLRLHHLRLYGWLGCITLETYISQFHIWMKTVLPNGQPKGLLVLLPGYPLVNFGVVSALYVLVSYRLFELTNVLKTAAVPHSNNGLLLRNMLLMLATGAAVWAVAWLSYNMLLTTISTGSQRET
ncbi:hypothetical protein Agub_g8221 [Astrephomene gubernaculifera]|uniref:Cas1p 10 TM acyl transferase domain-containing protein n=1 Tax=Astrephomene gubernaculifera TaxID=47775 RepID=A0AAD3HM95_9CHLO|nr:hypothetical protein Agub_g8213 [Astrephomene gubernaculifera]GFR46617.1 hypothetical protein Agub_g8221 [Astrephomene gubernaculifera]